LKVPAEAYRSRELVSLSLKTILFRVIDGPAIDTSSRTGKLVMGILALIAEFENDIRRERQIDGVAKAKERGVRFGQGGKYLIRPPMSPPPACPAMRPRHYAPARLLGFWPSLPTAVRCNVPIARTRLSLTVPTESSPPMSGVR